MGESRIEVARLIREAIQFHMEGTKADGLPIPHPHSYSELVAAGWIGTHGEYDKLAG